MHEIEGINFSIWGANDIRRDSVVHITEKKTVENGVFVENGLRDPRMGGQKICPTCGENRRRCNGHFGHIEFVQPVYHISWITNVIHWLRCICVKCGHNLIKDLKVPNLQRNKHLQYYSKHCHYKCPKCKERQPKYSWNKEKQYIEKSKEFYHINLVQTHLEMMDQSVLETTGLANPVDMLLPCLPVPPPTVRPAIMQGKSIRGEDDLTYRLLQIMRANSKLEASIEKQRPEFIIQQHAEGLQNAVTGYINHEKITVGRKRSSKREYTSLTARLKTKEGRIRGNLMGKRCDFTSRSVITGDDNLGMHEVGVPISVAKILSVPVRVTGYNKSMLQEKLDKVPTIVKFVVRPNGSRVDLSFFKGKINLDVGWTIERELQDGDIVLFNRQPSLHKMSIMAHEVKILPYSTFRMNLSCTTPYNADFDGDEMNIHVLQTVEAQAEARNIMAVKYQIVSPQSNRPVMSVIQDTMCGAYLLSGDDVVLDKSTMMHILLCIPGWDGRFTENENGLYTGKELISYVLPVVNWSKGGTVIECGKLVKGRLNKKVLGRSDGSLIHVIYNDCGPDDTQLFINRLQRIVHAYLSIRGHSVGVGDMLSGVNVKNEINKTLKDCKKLTTEHQINQRLNICRDTLGTMVQKPLTDDNRFYTMVHSGSKGSSINISQIMGVVGQQNLVGERIPNTWTDRTLPHFPRGSNGPMERGFITRNYVEGLRPWEVWFHAIAGREGLIDTAIKTSQTGYLQRRFMKALENISVHWDKTVRNANGSIVQFNYGDDGFDPMRIENQYIDSWDEVTSEKYGFHDLYDIQEDHDYLHEINKWRDNGSKDTGWFMLPVPVDRIIKNAQTIFSFPSRPVTEEEASEKMSSLLEKIENKMVKILIRSKLSSYKIVNKYNMTMDELENVIHRILSEYDKIHSIPGESVGAISAQSIGEPATQMTLNTFHFAGVSSMNVTLGIPRLEEIINLTKSEKMKTPLTIINPTGDPDKVVKLLKHIQLQDIVSKLVITKTPDVKEVESFMIFPDPDFQEFDADKETLVLYLKEWYDVLLIKEVLGDKVTCAYCDGPKSIFHIQMLNDTDIGIYYEQRLKITTIRGVKGAEQCIKIKPPGSDKYIIQTSLSDFSKLLTDDILDLINEKTLACNDIHAVFKKYGIEAARNTIIKEIRNILSSYGIYVNYRHITLPVDWMTWIGDLTPLTRHGIRKVDASPLKRSTFEEVVEVFNQAAVSNEKDSLNGVSECIIAGVPPKLGTERTKVILDKVVERMYKKPIPQEVIYEDMEDDQPWITMDVQTKQPPPLLNPWGPDPVAMAYNNSGIQQNPFQTPMYSMATGNHFGQFPNQYQFPMQTAPVVVPQNQSMGGGVALPSVQFAPTSPEYSPTSPGYDGPTSPAYDPEKPGTPPMSPMSPAYSPRPTSPAYSPTSPCASPVISYYPNGDGHLYQPCKRQKTYFE